MKHPWLDAHEIASGLWQGAFPPRGLVLRNAGFAAVVLCARELQVPALYYPEVEVIHAPNDDHPALPLTVDKLRIAVEASNRVAEILREGKKVLVTCAQGLNRSGLVVALALHRVNGWSGEQCIAEVRRRRRTRETHKKPLSNPDFTEALRKLPAKAQPAIILPPMPCFEVPRRGTGSGT